MEEAVADRFSDRGSTPLRSIKTHSHTKVWLCVLKNMKLIDPWTKSYVFGRGRYMSVACVKRGPERSCCIKG